MHATYRLRADELNEGFLQTLRNTYQQNEIIILSKDDYDEELEKVRHNTALTGKLQQRINALNEGKGIVKTMSELEALVNE